MSAHAQTTVAAKLQHGFDYCGQDIAGWHISEKLNGCRAYWDGQQLFSRSGRPIQAQRIAEQLPAGIQLDGEIYASRDNFESARLLTQYGKDDGKAQFVAFDAPGMSATWPERLALARSTGVKTVAPLPCSSHDEIAYLLRETVANGGEGLMARRPGTFYTPGRNNDTLKLKRYSLELIPIRDEVSA